MNFEEKSGIPYYKKLALISYCIIITEHLNFLTVQRVNFLLLTISFITAHTILELPIFAEMLHAKNTLNYSTPHVTAK